MIAATLCPYRLEYCHQVPSRKTCERNMCTLLLSSLDEPSAINLEEAKLLLSNPDAAIALASTKPDPSSGKKSQESFNRKNEHSKGDGNKKKKGDNQYVLLYHVHTELNQPQEQIYLEKEKTVPFRRADPMKEPRGKRILNK